MSAIAARIRVCFKGGLLGALYGCSGNSADAGSGSRVHVAISVDSLRLALGTAQGLTATVTDADGLPLPDATVEWSTTNPSRIAVTPRGVVSAIAAGSAIVSASSGGAAAAVTVRAIAAENYSIVGAEWTQGVQDDGNSVPMILGGNAAAVNVLLAATPPLVNSTKVVLRLFNASGMLVRSDTAVGHLVAGRTADYAAPSAQFLVPAPTLAQVATWQLIRDPDGDLPDPDASDDRFPRGGPGPLAKVAVPPLKIRFLPVALAANGNSTGAITTSDLPQYLRTVRSLFPVGAISASISAPFTSNADFLVGTSAGGTEFWVQLLAEIDLARVLAGDHDSYWMGVVAPPVGATLLSFAGFGYVPTVPGASGPGTRTAAAVELGWSSQLNAAKEGFAHELGHNFGRQHAPCGTAVNIDAGFPDAQGEIGHAGHDVYAWSQGETTTAPTVAATTGDIMGYCSPRWISQYTYLGIMAFRGITAAAATVANAEVLIVRGRVVDGRIELDPAFQVAAPPALPSGKGSYQLLVRNSGGEAVFRAAFDPVGLDHVASTRPFLFALPIRSLGGAVASIEATGPATPALLRQSVGAALRRGVDSTRVERRENGAARVICPSGAMAILVQRDDDGSMLAVSLGSSAAVAGASGLRLRVSCSSGTQSDATVVTLP